jgi:hypothetical protein
MVGRHAPAGCQGLNDLGVDLVNANCKRTNPARGCCREIIGEARDESSRSQKSTHDVSYECNRDLSPIETIAYQLAWITSCLPTTRQLAGSVCACNGDFAISTLLMTGRPTSRVFCLPFANLGLGIHS